MFACSNLTVTPPPFPPPGNMYLIPPRILFLFLFFSSLVAASNFTQCLVDFQNNTNPNAVGGVDSKGQSTSPAEAAGLTYETCTALCGPGAESFNWREFAQLFSSWLLPWLALISQLPFGSGDRADDFISGQPSFLFIVDSTAHLDDFHTISCLERGVSRSVRILPRPNLPERPIGLSQGKTR